MAINQVKETVGNAEIYTGRRCSKHTDRHHWMKVRDAALTRPKISHAPGKWKAVATKTIGRRNGSGGKKLCRRLPISYKSISCNASRPCHNPVYRLSDDAEFHLWATRAAIQRSALERSKSLVRSNELTNKEKRPLKRANRHKLIWNFSQHVRLKHIPWTTNAAMESVSISASLQCFG